MTREETHDMIKEKPFPYPDRADADRPKRVREEPVHEKNHGDIPEHSAAGGPLRHPVCLSGESDGDSTLTFELEGSARSDGTGAVLHAQDGSVTLLIGEDKE